MHPRKARKGGRWRIAELATLAGTTPRAYHKEGLLPEAERTDSGYRRYGSADLASLIGVRRLRSLGSASIRFASCSRPASPRTSRPPLKHSKLTSAGRSKQLQAATRVIDQIRTEGVAERELYARLAPKLRAPLDAAADPDPDALHVAPLSGHLENCRATPSGRSFSSG